MENDTTEYGKVTFMYDKVYDELNRSRDWPLKTLAVVTTLYSGIVIAFHQIKNIQCCIHAVMLVVATALLLFFCCYTIYVIRKQHQEYLLYRNIQRRLQRKLQIQDIKVDDKDVFPDEWTEYRAVKKCEGAYGWLYYASYVIIITALSIFLLYTV